MTIALQDEFRVLMAALGVVLSPAMAQAVLKHLDQNNDGQVDLNEFSAW